jgi:hypothetical protein
MAFIVNSQLSAYQDFKFQFNPVKKWKPTKEANAYIVGGTHNLKGQHNVWIFLRDRHQHFYLQNPPVELFDNGTWEASNIVIGHDIRYAWAIEVSSEGHNRLLERVSRSDWAAIELDYLERLPGYRKLASIIINAEELPRLAGDLPRPPKPDTSRPTTEQQLLVADFETGQDPIKTSGHIQSWNHGDNLKVQTGYRKLENKEGHGNFAAYVTLTKNDGRGEGNWSGGGLVLVFRHNESGLDVSAFKYLEFDIKASEGNKLKDTKIKLEDSAGGNRPERLLSKYGFSDVEKWHTIQIALQDFANLNNSDPKHWKKLNLKTVTKLVTVSVHNANPNDGDGTLLIDNVRFVR